MREVDRREIRQVVEDISLHAVWWRRRPVLWWGSAATFEEHRPWTHRVPATATTILAAIIVGACWLNGWNPWLIAAVATMALLTGIYVAMIEARFARWTARENRGARLNDLLRPPLRHRPDFEGVDSTGRDAVRTAMTASATIVRYVQARALWARRWGRVGWTAADRIADMAPVVAAVEAVAAFRELNESYSPQNEWDDQLLALTQTGGPVEERTGYIGAARAVIDTLRDLEITGHVGIVSLTRVDSRPVAPAILRLPGSDTEVELHDEEECTHEGERSDDAIRTGDLLGAEYRKYGDIRLIPESGLPSLTCRSAGILLLVLSPAVIGTLTGWASVVGHGLFELISNASAIGAFVSAVPVDVAWPLFAAGSYLLVVGLVGSVVASARDHARRMWRPFGVIGALLFVTPIVLGVPAAALASIVR